MISPKKQGFIKSSKPWDWEGVNWTQKMIDELKEILAKDSLVAFGFGKVSLLIFDTDKCSIKAICLSFGDTQQQTITQKSGV